MTFDKYLTAIVYCDKPQPVTNNQFLKFRNIQDSTDKQAKFCKFAAKFPGAQYVNFYYKDSKKFKERIYLQ